MSLCQGREYRLEKQGRSWFARSLSGLSSEKGAVIALVALFLPVAVLSLGIVADLGVIFAARRLAQAACDLGALAGCQELDWDLLAQGIVFIDEERGRAKAIEYTRDNLWGMENLFRDVKVTATVDNSARDAPAVIVEAYVVVDTYFLRWIPGLESGVTLIVIAESSVVERTKW